MVLDSPHLQAGMGKTPYGVVIVEVSQRSSAVGRRNPACAWCVDLLNRHKGTTMSYNS